MGMLSLQLLGPPELRHEGRPAPFATRKALALLVYLAVEGGAHSREKLVALLWPESDPERGRMALRRTLADARAALGEGADSAHLVADRTVIRFAPAQSEADLQALHEAWSQARLPAPGAPSAALLALLHHALARYRGDFLDGFVIDDAPAFDEWLTVQREQWHRRMSLVYERLAQLQLAVGDLTGAQETTARWIAHYPLNEAAHRHLMRVLLAAGDRPAALQAYAACRRLLDAELGAEPAPETEALVAQIRAPVPPQPALGRPTDGRPGADGPPASSALAGTRPSPPLGDTNLPAPPTPLIGRAEEVAALLETLRGGARLLTLIGPPGIGKTRLAIQVAAEIAPALADGACFVPLAPVSDPDLVAPTIMQALELADDADAPPARRLKEALRGRQLLLALDNFEQLQPAAGLVAELLAAAPLLTILVTSRGPLHLYGEHEWPVAPLALPDLQRLPEPESLAQIAAVRLFLERARAVQPALRLSAANSAAIAAICVRLDGLPLAIELAAARCRALAPQLLLERLSAPLDLLVGGPRDHTLRQQTLRGAIAWSDRLLSEGQRLIFAQLGVFVGGWDLAAAEALCGPEAGGPAAVGEALELLADVSMLRGAPGGDGAPRYGMLQAIREYALEQQAARGIAAELAGRHAAYYLDLAQTIEPQLKGAGQGALLDQLELEHDNMRAALGWALGQGDAGLSLSLCVALWWFWFVRGHLSEGRRWLTAALELDAARGRPEQAAPSRLGALNGAGVLAHDQGDYEAAARLLGAALALARQLGHQRGVGAALNNLGLVARSQGDYPRAAGHYAESLQSAEERGDEWAAAVALSNLGLVAAYQGHHAEAVDWYTRSLAIRKRMGDTRGLAILLNSLGESLQYAGEVDRAAALHAESLDLQRGLNDRAGMGDAWYNLGRVALLRRQWDEALRCLRACLALRRDLGDQRGIAECLESAAMALAAQERAPEAARALGAAHLLRELVGAPVPPLDLPDHERLVARTRAALGEDRFAVAWVAGETAARAGAEPEL